MPPLDPQAQQVLNQRNPAPAPAQQAPAPQPQQRGPVFGPAVVPDQVTPVQQASMQNAEARLDIARQTNDRAEEASQRGTVEQGRSASFLERAVHANENYDELGIGPRSLPGQVLADAFPRIANQFSDADRQRAEQAQREFIQAVLRYDSGAAIPEPEIAGAQLTYFPQPGDGPEVIAQKAEARRVAIQGLLASAGVAGERFMSQRSNGGQNAPAATMPMSQLGDVPSGGGANGGGAPPNGNGGDRGPYLGTVGSEAESAAWWGDGARYNANGQFVGEGYQGPLYDAEGNPQGTAVSVSPSDPTEGMGFLESIGESITGNARSTPEIEALPDWASMPELNSMSMDSFQTALGTMTGSPEEIAQIIQSQFPDVRVRQDANGNYILRSSDGNEYGIRPGFRTSDIPRAAGLVAAFTPAGRATTLAGAALGAAGTQAVIEGTQAATGGSFDPADIALAGAGGTAGLVASRAIAPVASRVGEAIAPLTNRVRDAARSTMLRGNPVENAADVVAAGERMGVPIRRPDVVPETRNARAQALQGDLAPTIRAADAEDLAAMEAALARNTGSEGAIRDPHRLGETAQAGARNIVQTARDRASTIYARAARLSENEAITPTTAIAEIDRNIAELTANGARQNAAQIKYLQDVRSDLSSGQLSVESLRAQRTQMRGNINNANLHMTDMDRRMNGVLNAVSDDIRTGLANNPRALALFERADDLWRQQAQFTETIGRRLLGTRGQPVSPEAAAARISAFVRGDFNRARELYGQLDEATRAEISAQTAASLGRTNNGNFSLANFLTHTSDGKGRLIDERTARLIFGDDGLSAIRDLRTLAQSKVAAAERTNHSNTGGIIRQAGRGLRTMILGGLGLSSGGFTGGALFVGTAKLVERLGEARAVRLLTDPTFTRWLRRLPETDNPRVIDGAFERLRRLVSSNSHFASDVQAFERALVGSNDNAMVSGNVAASPEEEQRP